MHFRVEKYVRGRGLAIPMCASKFLKEFLQFIFLQGAYAPRLPLCHGLSQVAI